MAKFKVGDKARLKYVRTGLSPSWATGAEVEVLKVHIGQIDENIGEEDYTVLTYDGIVGFPVEDQLEPIIELGNWDEIEDSIGWNPTKLEINHEL